MHHRRGMILGYRVARTGLPPAEAHMVDNNPGLLHAECWNTGLADGPAQNAENTEREGKGKSWADFDRRSPPHISARTASTFLHPRKKIRKKVCYDYDTRACLPHPPRLNTPASKLVEKEGQLIDE